MLFQLSVVMRGHLTRFLGSALSSSGCRAAAQGTWFEKLSLPANPRGSKLWTAEIRPMVTVGATTLEGIWSHWRLGFCGLVQVIGLEESLMTAQLHGSVGVREEVGEA